MDISASMATEQAVISVKELGSSSSRDDDHSEPVWKPSTHQRLIMICLGIVSVMIALDATIIVTSLSAIVADLKVTATQGFWIGTSYLLTCAVMMPFMAALSDIFGRPICLIVSLGFFTVGTIFCCVANTLTVMVVGRCVQGVGGGGVIILGLVIFTDIVPLRYRSKYYGIIQGAWALGTCSGPIVGGAIAQHTTWRWIFYLMFPFCFIGFATLPWLLTLKPRTETLNEKLMRVDWLGGVLFISSSTSVLIAISWGGSQESWSSFRTLVPLILGIVGLVITAIWETYGAREPFLRRNLFHCPSAFMAYAGATIQGFLLYGSLYYGPLYFLAVKQDSPITTGVSMLPITCSLVPASIVVGIVVSKINHLRWAIWVGWIMTTLAHGLMIIWDIDTSKATWAPIIVVLGLGHGLLLSAQNFATQAIALPKDEASAAAMYAFLRSFGMAIGVGIGGSVFQNIMKIKLIQFDLPVEIARNAEAYISILHTLPPESLMKAQVLDSFMYGLRGVFGLCCGIAGLAGILSLAIRHFNLDKELETEHKLEENRLSRLINDVDWKMQEELKGS